jgi:AraC family ethanolamine operon transcriptional activator
MPAFGCVEQMAETLTRAGLPLQLTQLAPGPLAGDLQPLDLGALQLIRVRFGPALHSAGPKLRRHQLLSLDLSDRAQGGVIRSHGQELPDGSIFGLQTTGEIHLTTRGATDLALVLIDRNRFGTWAADLGFPSLQEEGFRTNWLGIEPLRFARVRRYLRRLFTLAERCPQRLREPGAAQLIQDDLMPLLVEALAHANGQPASPCRPPARIELVKLAQRWMALHPERPLTLELLCREIYAGRRCLIQGFREQLGMGPMAYLKLQRLHAVRRTLLATGPADTTVAAEAARFGFLSPGHFARDYRRLFGERPSATLAAGLRSR